MKYYIGITATAEKELRKLPEKLQERLISKALKLGDRPRPFGCKKLRESNHYRIKVGDYRTIYSVDDAMKVIKILDIGHRKEIYR